MKKAISIMLLSMFVTGCEDSCDQIAKLYGGTDAKGTPYGCFVKINNKWQLIGNAPPDTETVVIPMPINN